MASWRDDDLARAMVVRVLRALDRRPSQPLYKRLGLGDSQPTRFTGKVGFNRLRVY